jgi:hypothetical protein
MLSKLHSIARPTPDANMLLCACLQRRFGGWPHERGNVRSSASVATLEGCKLSHNVSGVCLEAALHKTQLAIVACAACLYCDETETI